MAGGKGVAYRRVAAVRRILQAQTFGLVKFTNCISDATRTPDTFLPSSGVHSTIFCVRSGVAKFIPLTSHTVPPPPYRRGAHNISSYHSSTFKFVRHSRKLTLTGIRLSDLLRESRETHGHTRID